MAKKTNQKVVVFVKDYTNKAIGTVLKCDVVMASHLIKIGVAELKGEDSQGKEQQSKFKKKQKK